MSRPSITQRFVDVYYNLVGTRKVANKKDFCQRISLNASNFSQMEKGILNCSIENVCSLIAVFNINGSWLLTGSGEMYL